MTIGYKTKSMGQKITKNECMHIKVKNYLKL